jgi:hypothetical protein
MFSRQAGQQNRLFGDSRQYIRHQISPSGTYNSSIKLILARQNGGIQYVLNLIQLHIQ